MILMEQKLNCDAGCNYTQYQVLDGCFYGRLVQYISVN